MALAEVWPGLKLWLEVRRPGAHRSGAQRARGETT